jgi:hypothetical protein
MLTLTPKMFPRLLARALTDHDTPSWDRNQEWLACRLTAEKIAREWPPLMPMPMTLRQVKEIALRVKADTFRPEDIADIVAPVRI